MLTLLDRKQNDGDAALKLARPPAPEDFTGGAVTRHVLKESIEHPATIYPLAGAGLGLAWTLVIAASPASIGVSLGLAFVGASSFLYNFVVQGPEKATAYISRLRELRRTFQVEALEKLAVEADGVGLTPVAKEARELATAYQQLQDYLKQTTQLASVDRFSGLAEDSLRQGMHTLQQALAVFRAVDSIDIGTLQKELHYWQIQLPRLKPDSAEVRALKQQIDSHQRRINLYNQSQEKLSELIAESNEIETALQTTYLELVDFGNQNLDDFLKENGSAMNRLNQAVEAAKKVEDRLKGTEDPEEAARRAKYIQISEQSETANQQSESSQN
jgi:hypothetical protein